MHFSFFMLDAEIHSCEYHCLSGYHTEFKEPSTHSTKLDVPLNCTTE